MNDILESINDYLVAINEKVYSIEENCIRDAGYRDLSVSEIHTIDAVGIGEPLHMSSIAASLNITVGTLTVAVNNLVKKGYLEKYRSEEDRRVVNVILTETGKNVYFIHKDVHRKMVSASVGKLSDREGRLVVSVLEELNKYLSDMQ